MHAKREREREREREKERVTERGVKTESAKEREKVTEREGEKGRDRKRKRKRNNENQTGSTYYIRLQALNNNRVADNSETKEKLHENLIKQRNIYSTERHYQSKYFKNNNFSFSNNLAKLLNSVGVCLRWRVQ